MDPAFLHFVWDLLLPDSDGPAVIQDLALNLLRECFALDHNSLACLDFDTVVRETMALLPLQSASDLMLSFFGVAELHPLLANLHRRIIRLLPQVAESQAHQATLIRLLSDVHPELSQAEWESLFEAMAPAFRPRDQRRDAQVPFLEFIAAAPPNAGLLFVQSGCFRAIIERFTKPALCPPARPAFLKCVRCIAEASVETAGYLLMVGIIPFLTGSASADSAHTPLALNAALALARWPQLFEDVMAADLWAELADAFGEAPFPVLRQALMFVFFLLEEHPERQVTEKIFEIADGIIEGIDTVLAGDDDVLVIQTLGVIGGIASGIAAGQSRPTEFHEALVNGYLRSDAAHEKINELCASENEEIAKLAEAILEMGAVQNG
jgi:hypothetical protein